MRRRIFMVQRTMDLCRLMAMVWLAVVVTGCATVMRRDVLPERLVDEAELAGLAGVRTWGDASTQEIDKIVGAEAPKLRAKATAQSRPVSNLLAISGGAEDGAYGAGLLVGWSAARTRPQFDFVTGSAPVD